MAQNIARRLAGISLSMAVFMVALGCEDRSPSAPLPVVTENTTPTPTPTPTRYNLSGIVTHDAGSPVANAQLELYYDNTFKTAKTSTDARGHYSIAFETQHTAFDGNARVVGAIYYTGGGEYENYYVQAVPWGTADIVKNLRLRRVQTVNAGESIVISIDADSSLAYDGEDALRMDWGVSEKFRIRVADAGTLTVTTRPALSGPFPELAVYCRYVADNCLDSTWVNAPPGTAVRRVNANSVFEGRIAIPRGMVPQRYEVVTSLQ